MQYEYIPSRYHSYKVFEYTNQQCGRKEAEVRVSKVSVITNNGKENVDSVFYAVSEESFPQYFLIIS